jgi:hypothetical protein
VEKSLFYVVSWGRSAGVIAELNRLGARYEVELHVPGRNRFVFPNVPVRLYGEIRKVCGGDGQAYRDSWNK